MRVRVAISVSVCTWVAVRVGRREYMYVGGCGCCETERLQSVAAFGFDCGEAGNRGGSPHGERAQGSDG